MKKRIRINDKVRGDEAESKKRRKRIEIELREHERKDNEISN